MIAPRSRTLSSCEVFLTVAKPTPSVMALTAWRDTHTHTLLIRRPTECVCAYQPSVCVHYCPLRQRGIFDWIGVACPVPDRWGPYYRGQVVGLKRCWGKWPSLKRGVCVGAVINEVQSQIGTISACLHVLPRGRKVITAGPPPAWKLNSENGPRLWP